MSEECSFFSEYKTKKKKTTKNNFICWESQTPSANKDIVVKIDVNKLANLGKQICYINMCFKTIHLLKSLTVCSLRSQPSKGYLKNIKQTQRRKNATRKRIATERAANEKYITAIRVFVSTPLCNIATQCWRFDWQFARSTFQIQITNCTRISQANFSMPCTFTRIFQTDTIQVKTVRYPS